MSRIKRFSPLVILLLAIVAVFALGLDDYVSFEQLGHNRARCSIRSTGTRSWLRSRSC